MVLWLLLTKFLYFCRIVGATRFLELVLKDLRNGAVQLKAEIPEKDLTPGQSYGIKVLAENEMGIAERDAEINIPGEIENCKLRFYSVIIDIYILKEETFTFQHI